MPQGQNVRIQAETYHEYADKHVANAMESFISSTGVSGWVDIGERDNTNLFLKVMTKNIIAASTESSKIQAELIWQDNNDAKTIKKQWLTDENYQSCYDNTKPNGTGGDYATCHDTSGDTAVSYCSSLVLDGYSDWRLPTAEELIKSADINFTNEVKSFYWSFSELETVSSSAYMVTAGSSERSWNGKNASYYIRCITDK